MAHVLANELRDAAIKYILEGKLTESSKITNLKAISEDGYFNNYLIPETWEIVPLSECCYIHARIGWQALTKSEHQKQGDYLLITGTDFKNGFVDYSNCVYVSKDRYDMDSKIQLQNDDILITKDGTLGKVAVVKELPKPATLNSGVFVIRPDERFEKKYIEYLFQGSYFSKFVDSVKYGTTIKHLNQNKLVNFLIPVPSKEEQKSIVTKIDELMAEIDEYEKIENQLVELKKNFPGDMKAAVLQAAMQGKLTEQLESDGFACRKLLSTKNYSKIEELYDLPDNWINVHLEDLTNSIATKQYQILESDVCKEGKIPVISQSKEYSIGFTNHEERVFIPSSKIVLFGDHTTVVKTIDYPFVVGADGVKLFECTDFILPEYLYYVLTFNASLISEVGGYSRHYKYLKNKSIPLPPIEEQRRIVEKLDQLLPLCEELES